MLKIIKEHYVSFNYKNYKGDFFLRKVQPVEIYFGSTEWHPEPQWLLRAFDFDKKAERSFAMKDISWWGVRERFDATIKG